MNTKNINVEIQNKIATVTINRVESYNALNIEVLTEFKQVLTELSENKEIRGAIITGAGEKAFIAGADIKEMAPMNTEEALSFSLLGQKVSKKIENLPFPTVAAVNGFALGGGLEMAISCDFIFCTSNAVMGLPEVSLGLIPGFGGTQRLARLVGKQIAKEIIFTAKKINAEEAKKIGLVHSIYENKAAMINAANELLVACFKNSSKAISLAKNTLQTGIEEHQDQGLNIEANSFAGLFATPEMIEGTTAFIEKRKANF